MFEEHSFALCLTHDVDRPYKSWPQALYYAATERDSSHLRSMLPSQNPYWQFETIMSLEETLGVRSAFYFLNEPDLLREKPFLSWFSLENWVQQLGRYEITDTAITDVIRRLDAGGWEVGLHGSYHSYTDQFRLAYEKAVLESLLDGSILGGRQHYLNLDRPQTWQYHARLGLRYDTSLGSSTAYGFTNGYEVKRPFDDTFVVFPLTVMEDALPDPDTEKDEAVAVCDRLLMEAHDNEAVMTILWHLRYFNERDFPGYAGLYQYIVERAREMNAWIGPPGELYPHVADQSYRDESVSEHEMVDETSRS